MSNVRNHQPTTRPSKCSSCCFKGRRSPDVQEQSNSVIHTEDMDRRSRSSSSYMRSTRASNMRSTRASISRSSSIASNSHSRQTDSSNIVRTRVAMASKLGTLSLVDFGLTRIPESFRPLQPNLRSLDLSVNNFQRSKSFPEWFGSFPELKTLTLVNCHLSEIPPGVYSSSKLENLNLSNNKIRKIHVDISNLQNLKKLDITHNRIQKLPESISSCNRLEVLEASDNALESLPNSTCAMANLVEVNVNRNRLSDFPSGLSNCFRLKTLRAEENCLSLNENLKSILANSEISLFCLDGNLFTQKELGDTVEYQKYLERFTATKKKML